MKERDLPVALRRRRARRSPATARGPASRSGRRPAATSSCRSRCRTTSSRRFRCATTTSARSPPTLIAKHDLAPLPATKQASYPRGGGALSGALPQARLTPDVGDPALSFGLALPNYGPSCGDYLPVGVEVRLASRDEIDLDHPCAAASGGAVTPTASTASRRSASGTTAWPTRRFACRAIVRSAAAAGPPGDAYFSTLPVAETNCNVDVAVEVNWGTPQQEHDQRARRTSQ